MLYCPSLLMTEMGMCFIALSSGGQSEYKYATIARASLIYEVIRRLFGRITVLLHEMPCRHVIPLVYRIIGRRIFRFSLFVSVRRRSNDSYRLHFRVIGKREPFVWLYVHKAAR